MFKLNRLLPNKTLLFFTLLILVCTVQVFSQSILSYSKKDYNAASQNWSVSFDSKGYTYFGNGTGLLQFDGIQWQNHISPYSTIIRAVDCDSNNRIYSGGYRELGYWEQNSIGELQYYSLTDSVESYFSTNEEFWNIFTLNNKVVFHSFSGLYIYYDNHFKVVKPGGFINFATKIDDQVYITILNQGIYQLQNDKLVLFIDEEFIKDKLVRFFESTGDPNTFYVGTESKGLYTYNILSKEFKRIIPELNDYFTINQINHGIVNNKGHIIIGTILDGVIAITDQGEVIFHFNKENGLQSNTVLGLGIDRLNNIWLALDTGIEFIPSSLDRQNNFIYEEELGAVYSAALFNNQLYVGTNQGLYVKPWNDQKQAFKLLDNTQGQVWDCKIIDDKLFVGHNSGTIIIEKDRIRNSSKHSGAYCIARHPQDPNILMQGTYNDLVVYKKLNGHWQFSHPIKGFSNLIRFIEFDHLGNIWASHVYQGIYKLTLNENMDSVMSIKHYDIIDSNDETIRNSRAFKVEGRIVITTGKQMYTYDDLNDSIIPYTEFNNNLGEYKTAHRIVASTNHRYWFINKGGLACFHIRPDKIENIKRYPKSLFHDHLIPGHENIVQINDSNIIVCMENGYSLLNILKQEEGMEISKHALVLRKVSVSDRNKNVDIIKVANNKIVIPNRKNNLKLQYSFPILNGDPIVFQYKIEGLLDEWSSPTEKPIFELTRIPAGEYQIFVKALNNWQKSSLIHQLNVTVLPPWYRSWPAIFSYVILLTSMLILSKRITTRKVKLKERRKQDIKEKELIQLRNEKLRSELSHKSQQLASSTMGIIKKNEFLLSLKAKIRKQKEALGSRFPDKYYQNLISKIDENISGQDDWKLFEANFEQAHETFLHTLKSKYPELTPGDLRLCAYLRVNLTSKEIAPLLGISVRGVENHRYRLRKKLLLSAEENLIDFILNV